MSTAAASTGAFDQQVASLMAVRGEQVPIAEVADIVGSLVHSLSGDISSAQLRVSRELNQIVAYIDQARVEIAALQPNEIRSHHIPKATDELDAVVDATANATSAILDAAEEIEKLAGGLPGEHAERANSIATKIYEASNFQDLTGQRITKVVATLQHIEQRIGQLARALGHELDDGEAAPVQVQSTPVSDADLLNGPQLPQHANSQAEIDALLASFDN